MFTILKTILKSIFSGIGFCCKIVYGVLKLLKIRLLALYLVVCGILQLALHIFVGREYLFWVGVGVCSMITILAWIAFFHKKFAWKSVKRERPQAEENETVEEAPEPNTEPVRKTKKERAKYYDVAGRPDFVFAEYSDRFELYYKEKDGLTLVRTDYKSDYLTN